MAASPSSVITLGYGSWGSVNLIPTLGFGSAEEVVITVDGRDIHLTWEPQADRLSLSWEERVINVEWSEPVREFSWTNSV
jgi:hypothetical protein